ncbi:MAG: 6,7-dimethyl-8-ribityllumazine synthase [Candidatus Omnitrophica bacterium]|nr:6,7-dimethyl-8-ribityllumazine synthase [Candidatus Omnitrophota bacterium]
MKKKVLKNSGKGIKIAVVVSRFNEEITQRLLKCCLDQLSKLGVNAREVQVAWVPGAFEIPLVALKYANKKDIDAVICLGAVIEGQTDHYRLVIDNATSGIMQVALQSGKPVIFEILAAKSSKLVEKRSQMSGRNKGRDAAETAVEMVNLISTL